MINKIKLQYEDDGRRRDEHLQTTNQCNLQCFAANAFKE